jgi:flavin reductase (DIM6/NTAB) family NADH-FMN oxidoreductase RutF
VTPPQLAAVLGRLPSGLFVLTARRGDEETGMLASWVMQAGFEPPMITVALRHDRQLAEWLSGGVPFVINLLAEDQKPLMARFGRTAAADRSIFEGLDIHRTADGVPALENTVGYLECTPAGSMDSGDHRIFLAHVLAGHLADGRSPLVHIRKNGMKY